MLKGRVRDEILGSNAHSNDAWSSDNLSCHLWGAALRSAEVTVLHGLQGVKASGWGPGKG